MNDGSDHKRIVVKVSGSLLDDAPGLNAFWEAMQTLRQSATIVVVHGGGVQATDMARRLGHEPRVVQGRRVTTDLDLDIMQWALRGKINTQLVAQARRYGITAIGLSGVDGGLLRAKRRPAWTINGETVDFGWVGDIEHVETDVLGELLAGGLVPIVAPLGADADGQVYNINADTVAQALAAALHADQLLLVTPTGGVRREADQPSTRVETCTPATFESGISDGWIWGGMRVKLQVAFDALDRGVPEALILAPDDLNTQARATRVVA